MFNKRYKHKKNKNYKKKKKRQYRTFIKNSDLGVLAIANATIRGIINVIKGKY